MFWGRFQTEPRTQRCVGCQVHEPRDGKNPPLISFSFGTGLEDRVGASLHHGDGEEISKICQSP
jgi:hypothetical protein